MKVIKVIVDEIPSCCRVCEYLVRNSMLASTPNGCHCGLTAKFMTIEMTETRPDWCPLITEAELLKQVASPFSKWEESED